MRYVIRLTLSVIISFIIMLVVFYFYIYESSYLNVFLKLITEANYLIIFLALILKTLPPFIHSIAWYLVLKKYVSKCDFWRVIEISFTSLNAEYLIPIGGATELVKIGLISSIYKIDIGTVAFSVATHRIGNSLALALITFIAITYLGLINYLGLIISALILLITLMNLTILLALKAKRTIKYLVSLSRKLLKIDYEVKGLQYIPAKIFLAVLFLSLMEHLIVSISSFMVINALGLSISFWKVVIVFNSLYSIIWVLPVLTPGFIGILDWFQILVLKALAIHKGLATTVVIYNTLVRLLAEVPMFTIATIKVIGRNLSKIIEIAQKHSKKS